MPSGKIQLTGISPETETIFIGDPQISFFKIVYKRHTNFAIENKTIHLEIQDIDKGEDTVIEIKLPIG